MVYRQRGQEVGEREIEREKLKERKVQEKLWCEVCVREIEI